MKINESTKLLGNKIILVPYKIHHVQKYHNWMKSKELLEKTASLPLSLEEEYKMQESWWQDEDKCTFIILCKDEKILDKASRRITNVHNGDVIATNTVENEQMPNPNGEYLKLNTDEKLNTEGNVNKENSLIANVNSDHSTETEIIDRHNEIKSMVGDVNLFFNNSEEPHAAELEIMIAESEYRRRGMGKEAVKMMMHYGYHKLNANHFAVRIGENNTESVSLFKKLGFFETDYSEVFKEKTLKLNVEHDNFKTMMLELEPYLREETYL